MKKCETCRHSYNFKSLKNRCKLEQFPEITEKCGEYTLWEPNIIIEKLENLSNEIRLKKIGESFFIDAEMNTLSKQLKNLISIIIEIL